MKSKLVLASGSPRRRELLERVGYEVDVRPPDVDETMTSDDTPDTYVERVATTKVRAVPRAAGEWVLAADTIVVHDQVVLHKTGAPVEAERMLRMLAGHAHLVMTAFAIMGDVDGQQIETHARVVTSVSMMKLDDATVPDYIACGEWRGKAGAYAIQGIGASLVSRIDGSVTNVIGLPLAEVLSTLRHLGGPLPNFALGTPA